MEPSSSISELTSRNLSRNPVLELHGSRKLGTENQSIETALVNIEHLLGSYCSASILSKAARNLATAFCGIKVVNQLFYSIIRFLIPQHITDILCTELRFSFLKKLPMHPKTGDMGKTIRIQYSVIQFFF